MIASKDEIKSMLNIPQSDTSKDVMIQSLLPIAESIVQTQTNNNFENGYPKALKLFVAKFIEWLFPNKANTEGIESEKFDSEYAVKYITKTNEIPVHIMQLLEPFQKLSW